MDRRGVTVVVEGLTDEPIARRVVDHCGHEVSVVYVRHGKAKLDAQLDADNRAARFGYWFVLRDLDRDAACAPEIVARLLPRPSSKMRFRLAVRAMEAWLLADREIIAASFRLPVKLVPLAPDELADPKAVLMALARQSRDRRVREDFLPVPHMSARVGPGYVGAINELASRWRPTTAARRSPSLRACMESLATL